MKPLCKKEAGAVALQYARRSGPPGKAPLQPLPAPRLRVAPGEVAAATRRFGLDGPYAVLCPGAEYGPAKRWPYFKELALCLGIEAVLLGSGSERESGAGIPGNNPIGKT